MKITQTKSEALKREFSVVMTAEEIDVKVNEKLAELGKTVSIPGFRPGKVPLPLLKSKYGKSVMGEVLESAVNDSTLKAINENNLRPAQRPKIEVKSFEEGKGLEYTMAIELLPEFQIADLTKLSFKKLTAKPEQKTIADALQRIADSNKASEKIDENRAVKIGEIAVIDFDGTVDGKPFPGMKGNDFALELGSKSFVDTFEEQLVGAKVGDKRTVTVTFPKDYQAEKLQGVKAVFEVTVKELRRSVKPEINEDFAKNIGFESLAKLEEAISKQVQAEYDRLSRMNIKRDLLDALDEKHTFDIPPGMVDSEFESILHQVQGPHDHNNPDHKHDDVGTPEERKEYRALAERRVKLGLVLAEIGRTNKIEVTNQELQQAVINEARRYPGQERQVFEYYQQNPQALDAVKAPIYEDKVVDFVLEKSKIDTQEVSIEELTAAAEKDTTKKSDSATSDKSSKKTGKK
jgi:trigger factor